MLKPTNRRLQFYWWLLTGAIVVASLLPHIEIGHYIWGSYFNWPWIHFAVYLVVSILPVLAWRLRTALAMCVGMAVISVGLEIVRGVVLYGSVRFPDILVNLLGVAAGSLLALNIVTLRTRTKQVDQPGTDVSESGAL